MSISQNFPTIRPTLNLNFARSKRLDPRITFERSSVGTYVDEDGLIKYASADEARFDHDSSTGESLGLLIEEQRNNLYSGTTSYGFQSTSQEGFVTSPDGSSNATAVRIDGDGYHRSQYNINLSAGRHSFSIFVKNVEGTNISPNSCAFQAIDIGGNGGWSIYIFPSSVQIYANGWRRLKFENFNISVSSYYVTYFYLNIQSSNNFVANNDLVGVWGGQLESGSFATSYIPKPYYQSTRNADTAQITGTNFSSWYNASESTILCDYSHIMSPYTAGQATGNERAYRFRAVGGNDTRIDYVTYNAYHPYIAADGSQVANLTGFTGLYDNQLNKTAVVVKQNDFAVASNGILKSQDFVGNWPPSNTITEVSIGSQNGVNVLNGHIKKFVYYPERLTNEQLQNLTK